MIFTSYCEVEPIASDLDAARRAMSVEHRVDMEDALQRWGLMGPEEAHIYTRIDARRQILARRVHEARRFLVGVHDLRDREIVVVSMDRGPIGRAVRPAFRYVGPVKGPITVNPNWTG